MRPQTMAVLPALAQQKVGLLMFGHRTGKAASESNSLQGSAKQGVKEG